MDIAVLWTVVAARVLVPLAEVAPQFVHPVMHKEIRQLLAECDDISYVERWNPNGAHHESLILNS